MPNRDELPGFPGEDCCGEREQLRLALYKCQVQARLYERMLLKAGLIAEETDNQESTSRLLQAGTHMPATSMTARGSGAA